MSDSTSLKINPMSHKDYTTYFRMILLGSILLYAFSRFIYSEASQIAQGVLLVYLIYLLVKNPDQFRRDPMFFLLLGVIISQIATWASVAMFLPEFSKNKLMIDKLAKLFFFIPIAWGLKDRPKWVPIVLLVACGGFTVDIFFGCNFFSQMGSAINGNRVDFGVRNAQHPSMVFGLMVIISTFYMVIDGKKVTKGIAFLVFMVGLAGLMVTQTRQTFLGIIVAAVVVFCVSCLIKKNSLKKIIISIVVIGVLAGTAGYSITKNRQKDIWETFKTLTDPLPEGLKSSDKNKVLAYYINKLNNNSGKRLQLWLAVLPYMPRNPLFGWGGSCIPKMIVENPLLEKVPLGEIRHLHNYHITLYLCYGISGFLLVNGIYIWLLISLYRIRKQITNGDDWFLLSVGFVVYWLVINCFENFNGFWTGVFCHNLILGCIYSRCLAKKKG